MKITHVTPHLGGGMGTVILKLVEKDTRNTHRVISLDTNNNDDWKETDKLDHVKIYNGFMTKMLSNLSPEIDNVLQDLKTADVILIHWFNHPLLFNFMVNSNLRSSRVVIWNHVSGLYPPYVHSRKLIEFSDRFIFTSPISYECNEIKSLPTDLKERLGVIWSTYGVEDLGKVERISHDDFVIGFTGTVDYGKLHHEFIKTCAKIDLPGSRFVVCSGDSQQHLIAEAESLGVSSRFSFEGRVPSVVPYLAGFDVFGYPLQKRNFATCEQAIGEAMACGAVPVVLANPAESYIVEHMISGIVAADLSEYTAGIELLYRDRDLLSRLSSGARKRALLLYNADTTVSLWNKVFEEVMEFPRKDHIWAEKYMRPHQVYAISLGTYGKPFMDYVFADMIGDTTLMMHSAYKIRQLFDTNTMFRSANKGSVIQYLRFFPDDKYLQAWSDIAKS